MVEVMDARAAQLDQAWKENEGRTVLLRRLVDTHPPPDTYPEEYAKWLLDPRIAYFAVFAVYLSECHREGKLRGGSGPFYCPVCEEAQEGWRRLHCWECAWSRKIRPYAIELASNWHESRRRNSA